MKRIAVKAATARLAASLSILAALVAPAFAGEAASFNALGFSGDGRYFAFEEFGIQDGSGFPYANITILDVATDSWAEGSPFRFQLDDDGASLADARAAALNEAEPHLDRLQINTPVTTVALNGDGEPSGDGSVLRFGRPGIGLEAPQDLAELTLTTTLPDYSGPCTTDYGFDQPVGYTLTVESAGNTTELHADDTVPKSRGCTVAYRLYGVFAPFEWNAAASTPVAVISVYTQGFEGPDRRFIAVPVTGYP